jgi:hypothetical protein
VELRNNEALYPYVWGYCHTFFRILSRMKSTASW